MQENRDDGDVPAKKLGQQILEKNLVNSVLACCLDRADNLRRMNVLRLGSDNSFVARKDQVQFIRHLITSPVRDRDIDCPGFARQAHILNEQLDKRFEKVVPHASEIGSGYQTNRQCCQWLAGQCR